MCKMYVVNQLNLGNRKLGYELFNGKEIVEMTEKMLKDSIVSGKEVYGMRVVNDELVLDKENFFMRNMMIHSHLETIQQWLRMIPALQRFSIL